MNFIYCDMARLPALSMYFPVDKRRELRCVQHWCK